MWLLTVSAGDWLETLGVIVYPIIHQFGIKTNTMSIGIGKTNQEKLTDF